MTRDADPVVLVTRPEPDGTAFLDLLRRAAPGPWRGVSAPLTRIAALPPPRPPEGAELVLTSRNALRASSPGAFAGRRAWCVGRATAAEARAAGLVIAGVGGGDADALVALVLKARPDVPLLHLRGEPSTGDVAGRLRAAGLRAEEAVVYRQEPAAPGPAFRGALGAAGGGLVVAPVFSPRGARRLSEEAGDAALHAVALSPAVAVAVSLRRARVEVCARPDGAAMVGAVAALLAPGGDP